MKNRSLERIKENKFVKQIVKFVSHIILELLVVFFVFFTINNYLEEPEVKIGGADGMGYYDYLPSIFIRNDLDRKDVNLEEGNEQYAFVGDGARQGVYVPYKDKIVNKYAIGTAILQLPFFYAELIKHDEDDEVTGYEHPFHTAVLHAVAFYFFLSLIFLKLILLEFEVKKWIIFFIQLLVAIGTNVLHYIYYEPSFSHIYSFFAINVFLFFALKYFKTSALKYFLFACLAFGMIVNIRQVNILIVLILPLLAGDFGNLKTRIIFLFRNYRFLILGILIFLAVVFIQLYVWYLQTGDWLVYSYQNESFDFIHPHFIDILFSYKKGLFIYTPIVFFCFLSVFWFLIKKKYYFFMSWLLFFLVITYILSSWWSWFYGCSFGLRAYIDFYAVLFLPFALFLNQIKRWVAIVILLMVSVLVPVNIIQTFQYERYILHWTDMDVEMYWKVFLKTEAKYNGLVWLDEFDFENQTPIHSIEMGDLNSAKDTLEEEIIIYTDSIEDFAEVNNILLVLENDFQESSNVSFEIWIEDPNKVYYFLHNAFLIQFAHDDFGKDQIGYYSYRFEKMSELENGIIHFRIKNIHENLDLRNVKLNFYKG